MAVASVKSGPSAAQVRAWGRAQGITEGTKEGTRGRLNPALVSAFNAKHKGSNAYKEGASVETVTVKAKPAKGRTIVRTVNVAQVRAAAKAAGLPVGARGRVPAEMLSAYVLGVLGE